MQATKIKITWSNSIKVFTIFTSLLFLVVEYILINKLIIHYDLLLLSIFLFILLLILSFIVRIPLYIVVNENGILLKRVVGKIHFPYNEIVFVDRFSSVVNVRLCGSGGFLGHLGVYSNRNFGIYQSYVENPKDAFIIIRRDKKKFVLSCNDSENVIQQIHNKIYLERKLK